MKRLHVCLSLLAIIILLPADRLYAASWPLFRASAQRTGNVTEYAGPKLSARWSYEIQGGIISSPVIYKGLLYMGARDGSVLALNATTGETIWQYSTNGWVDATPCVSSDTVYVPGRDQTFYAFDRLTGTIRWQTTTGSTDCSSPVLSGGKLYFLSGYPNKCIYCLNAADGRILANYPVSQFGFSSPAIRADNLYFGTNDGQFHCLDLASGRPVWDRPTNGGIFYSSVAAGDNAIYAVSGGDEHKLFAFDPGSGNILWQSVDLDTQTATVSSVALAEDRVVVACSKLEEVASDQFVTRLKLFAFPLNGSTPVTPLWVTDIGITSPLGIVSSPCIADGIIYVGSGDGSLYCLNASNGKYIEPGSGNLTTSSTGFYLCSPDDPTNGIVSSPVVANGMVYVGTSDGMLWAFDADNVNAINVPDNGDRIINRVTVNGTSRQTSPAPYRIEYGQGSNPSSWSEVVSGTAPVTMGTLGDWNTVSLSDGQYSLRLTINDDIATRAQNVVNIDNSPRAPTNLLAQDTPFDGGGSISLTWNASADDSAGNNDVAGYRVYKSTYPGGYALLAQLAKGTTGLTDASCPVYTTFYYVLTAFDQSSESTFSNAAAACSIADGVEISPETGGTVAIETNGMTTEVVIPPGSIARKAWVGIHIPDNPSSVGIPTSVHDTKIVREFGISPAGTQFSKPAIIKLPYRPQDVTDMKRENLRIYWWDTSKNEWRIVNTSDPNAEDGRVWAAIPHFSLYRVMEYTPGSEELLSPDKVYTYPNPAKGDKVYFKFYLGDKADITVDIYNVAAELIAHIEKAACPAGLVSEVEWNISGIASGVYVYKLEAKAGSGSKSVKKKMAVIH